MKVKGASLVMQMVKNLPIMQETWVRSLGREDPLEKGMAINSSIFAWRIPWTEEPGGLYSPWGHKGACGILFPRLGIGTHAFCSASMGFNHWTTKEVSHSGLSSHSGS